MRTYSVIVVNTLEKCSGDDKPAGMLFQYDYGQKIAIGGVTLPAAYEVHFSNQKLGKSVTVIGDVTGIVDIPDAMLLTGQDVHVWLYLHQGEDDGETVYYARIAVKGRAKPTHETPTPVQQDEITQAIAALNAAVEATGADAAAAEDSAEDAGRAQAAAEAAQDRAEAAQGAAESAQTGAETAQDKAEDAQEAAEGARDRAETAAQLLEDCSAEAETLTAGSAATASYSEGVFHFGIPRGSKGSKGDPGDRGPEGPTGPEGPEGPAGYSPTASVSKSGSTATISITDKTGTTTATVSDGQDGAPGQDGYTPQRGTDYWTAEDKAEILADAEAEFSEDISDITADLSLVKDDIDGKAPVILQTASGDIVSFTDGADNMPLSSCVVSVDPVQDLHGQANPYPAGGGKNKWYLLANGYYSSSGAFVASVGSGCSDKIPVTVGQSYTFSAVNRGSNTVALRGYYFDSNNTIVGSQIVGGNTVTTTVPENAETVALWFAVTGYSDTITQSYCDSIGIQFESGSSASSFAPYSNVCPISGWTGANVSRTGINLASNITDKPNSGSVLYGYYGYPSGAKYGYPMVDKYFKAGTYAISMDVESSTEANRVCIWVKKSDGEIYKPSSTGELTPAGSVFYMPFTVYSTGTTTNRISATLKINEDVVGIYFGYYSYGASKEYNNLQIELGSTVHAYTPYIGSVYPVSWQTAAGTVYGGTVDTRTGVLTVTHTLLEYDASPDEGWLKVDGVTGYYFPGAFPNTVNTSVKPIDNIFKWNSNSRSTMGNLSDGEIAFSPSGEQINIKSSTFGTLEDFKAYLAAHPLRIVAQLYLFARQTYQLDPVQITTLFGQNHIWSDTGAISVTYPADTKLYIQQLTKPTEDDMTANTAITSGKFFMVGNRLFLATAAIAVGATIIPGTNCTELSLADALNNINA